MARKMKTMDGNNAAAHVSYAFTDVAAIYPITPSSVMAEVTDTWSAAGQKNLFGQTVKVMEMQSEAGAAGTVHGSLAAGALTTTYTASQGLLLMIPNMYKMAGELLPAVIHVSARALASHALSIFGDHSDVMACRQTGFAMLASSNPQEVMDLGAVAHLSAIKGKIPFLHFFDGFRTSHEIQKVAVWDYADLDEMLDKKAVSEFRANALNPEHPVLRGSAQNPDIFFQAREACNTYYNDLPAVVEEYMDKVNDKIGTDYKLFNYYGAPDAERVIIAMGSICDTAEETIDYLLARGEKVGLIKVRLYRPFVMDKFALSIPKTCKKIAVLDRTKEPGAQGEPLYLDVVTALSEKEITGIRVVGGRYGLGSKDTTPGCVISVFENLNADIPKNHFTVGITDDVTNLSLPIGEDPITVPEGTISCKFWGLGADGTVGANKNSIKIIGDHTDMFSQAYFDYDSKKTGGITVSHLRFGHKAIKSTYLVSQADFVACHNPSYLDKYDMAGDIKDGGTFLLNCQWTPEELEKHLPNSVKSTLAKNHVNFYIVDAISKAREIGLGKRTNTILQSAFFKLANVIPMDKAVQFMKEAAYKSFSKKGDKIVEMNYAAIDAGVNAVTKIEVPAEWATLESVSTHVPATGERKDLVDYVNNIQMPINAQKGNTLKVSTFMNHVDGTSPQGSAAFEKRGVAVDVPTWIPENCIQCGQCSLVCPHACIRPYALDANEVANAPEGFKTADMKGRGLEALKFSIAISPLDCMGCNLCANVCPSKEKSLVMKPIETQLDQQPSFDYAVANITEKETGFAVDTVKGSQFKQPLLEFSGACAGCVETAYAKLVTQLFGDRMFIANATGCSSIWAGSSPSTPYTVNKNGMGPAWANSLFEDNAEFGLGMNIAVMQRREKLANELTTIANSSCASAELKAAANEWLENKDDADGSKAAAAKVIAEIAKTCDNCECKDAVAYVKEFSDMLVKKSMWIFGGDGWAYDIGFGGLDHVIASGQDVNIFVFDTEVYSNTGGQASKSSQIGQVAQFAASGKAIGKKDLAAIAMSYGYVYVAQVGLGANYQQTIKAIAEAEAYKGPSLIIGYAPCEMHGVRGGMSNSQAEIKSAVAAGYWHLFRFNPELIAEGKNPFIMDSKAPTASYKDFILNENRYTTLTRTFPERATELFEQAEAAAQRKYDHLDKLTKLV
ncbi:MAG: pyruvate:ferredoxin (flavodoxin) oxidoreductase [Clostridia bacterium]